MMNMNLFLFLFFFFCFELNVFVKAGNDGFLYCEVTGDPMDISMPDIFKRLPEYNKQPYGNSFITLNFDTRNNEMPLCKKDNTDNEDNGNVMPSFCNTSGFCNNFYDIVFSIEESSFAGRDNWIKVIRPFVQKTVKAFKISKDEVHLAIVLFASDTRSIVKLSEEASQDKEMLIQKIEAIDDVCKTHGVLYADSLLYALDYELLGNGQRTNASKVSVLFTYGTDNNTNKPLIPKVVQRYKESCVKLIVFSTMITEDILSLVECRGDVSTCPGIINVHWEYIMSAAPIIKERVCEDKEKDEFDEDSMIK